MLAACGLTAASTARSERESAPTAGRLVVLAVGQQIAVGSGKTLVLEAIVEDSRCPARVTCVWAGRVKAAFSLKGGSGVDAFELSDGADPVAAQGLRFALESVQPDAAAPGGKILAGDYRVSVRISGG